MVKATALSHDLKQKMEIGILRKKKKEKRKNEEKDLLLGMSPTTLQESVAGS